MESRKHCPWCMGTTGEDGVCPECGRTEMSYQPSLHHLPPGSILSRRYVVGRVLGEGGFGITYLGLDICLEMKVAIKEYFPKDQVSRDTASEAIVRHTGALLRDFDHGLERFLHEARTMARMEKQPQIVTVRDYFKENGTAYIVMEFVEGTTLTELVAQKGGRIRPEELFPIIEPLFGALESMHSAGIIHRDISPDNLMLENGQVRLLDFGCARETRSTGNTTMTATIKYGYGPVEQYQGKGQGPWTDIYALSATIYYCLTGRKPPQAMDRIVADELIPPGQLCAELTPGQERAILKGMQVRPQRRYRSVREFYAAIYTDDGTGEVPYGERNRKELAREKSVQKPYGTTQGNADRKELKYGITQGNADRTVLKYETTQGNADRTVSKSETTQDNLERTPPKSESTQGKMPAAGKRQRQAAAAIAAAVLVFALSALLLRASFGSGDSESAAFFENTASNQEAGDVGDGQENSGSDSTSKSSGTGGSSGSSADASDSEGTGTADGDGISTEDLDRDAVFAAAVTAATADELFQALADEEVCAVIFEPESGGIICRSEEAVLAVTKPLLICEAADGNSSVFYTSFEVTGDGILWIASETIAADLYYDADISLIARDGGKIVLESASLLDDTGIAFVMLEDESGLIVPAAETAAASEYFSEGGRMVLCFSEDALFEDALHVSAQDELLEALADATVTSIVIDGDIVLPYDDYGILDMTYANLLISEGASLSADIDGGVPSDQYWLNLSGHILINHGTLGEYIGVALDASGSIFVNCGVFQCNRCFSIYNDPEDCYVINFGEMTAISQIRADGDAFTFLNFGTIQTRTAESASEATFETGASGLWLSNLTFYNYGIMTISTDLEVKSGATFHNGGLLILDRGTMINCGIYTGCGLLELKAYATVRNYGFMDFTPQMSEEGSHLSMAENAAFETDDGVVLVSCVDSGDGYTCSMYTWYFLTHTGKELLNSLTCSGNVWFMHAIRTGGEDADTVLVDNEDDFLRAMEEGTAETIIVDREANLAFAEDLLIKKNVILLGTITMEGGACFQIGGSTSGGEDESCSGVWVWLPNNGTAMLMADEIRLKQHGGLYVMSEIGLKSDSGEAVLAAEGRSLVLVKNGAIPMRTIELSGGASLIDWSAEETLEEKSIALCADGYPCTYVSCLRTDVDMTALTIDLRGCAEGADAAAGSEVGTEAGDDVDTAFRDDADSETGENADSDAGVNCEVKFLLINDLCLDTIQMNLNTPEGVSGTETPGWGKAVFSSQAADLRISSGEINIAENAAFLANAHFTTAETWLGAGITVSNFGTFEITGGNTVCLFGTIRNYGSLTITMDLIYLYGTLENDAGADACVLEALWEDGLTIGSEAKVECYGVP